MTSLSTRMAAVATLAVALFFGLIACETREPPSTGVERTRTKPAIFPDYASTVIPPNLAPIRFRIVERGITFRTRIHGDHGTDIVVSRTDPSVPIPEAEWHGLLERNRGGMLRFEITVQDPNGSWRRFDEFEVQVAAESVDNYLVFRRKLPGKAMRQSSIQIRQRALGSFEETVVLDNARLESACINCHSFAGNKSRFMALSYRSLIYGVGTLLVVDGKIEKIPQKFGFATWHPSGDVIVFSQNRLNERGSDTDSQLLYYRRSTRTVHEIPGLARPEWLEDIATFSADGRELYAATARKPWGKAAVEDVADEVLRRGVPTDLVRVRFDIEKDTWSEPEVVVSSSEMGKSVIIPRTSPDGHWLSMRMLDPFVEGKCDIYLVDLRRARETGHFEPKELGLSVGFAQGWHAWSSEGKWLVFSSSRDTGLFTRPYLTYVDDEGRAHKPVLLPVEDPAELRLDPFMYDVPEFVDEPVRVTARSLAHAIRSGTPLKVNAKPTTLEPARYK